VQDRTCRYVHHQTLLDLPAGSWPTRRAHVKLKTNNCMSCVVWRIKKIGQRKSSPRSLNCEIKNPFLRRPPVSELEPEAIKCKAKLMHRNCFIVYVCVEWMLMNLKYDNQLYWSLLDELNSTHLAEMWCSCAELLKFYVGLLCITVSSRESFVQSGFHAQAIRIFYLHEN